MAQMRERIDRFVRAGGNVAFFDGKWSGGRPPTEYRVTQPRH
jgi:hypothetical protein